MNAAATKIQMIKASVRCLVFGILGLLPIIGLPFALAALWISGQARVKEKLFWNVARPQRLWGVACAAIGAILWGLIDTLLIFRSFSNYIHS